MQTSDPAGHRTDESEVVDPRSSYLSRRAILGAGLLGALGLTGVANAWRADDAEAAWQGYNLPFTDLVEPGKGIPTYVANDPYLSTRGRRYPHTGIDFSNYDGQGHIIGRSVRPIRSGQVLYAGWDQRQGPWDLGNQVIVRQDDGHRAVYAHLATFGVAAGQMVTPSTTLGTVGNTGASTGPHLHITMYKPDGSRTDPWPYLDGAPYANQVSSNPSPPPPPALFAEDEMRIYQINDVGGLQGTVWAISPGALSNIASAGLATGMAERWNPTKALIPISSADLRAEMGHLCIPDHLIFDLLVGGNWSLAKDAISLLQELKARP